MKTASMERKLHIRNGRILLWRLGNLNFGEQLRWSRAPEKKGMWAFPYPYFEMFFAHHQYTDLLPKSLKVDRETGLAMSVSAYEVDSDIYSESEPFSQGMLNTLIKEGLPLPEGVETRFEFHTEREQWVKDVAMRIHPVRKFWYEGDLYSHYFPDGLHDIDEWHRQDAALFGKQVYKAGGDTSFFSDFGSGQRPVKLRTSADHLEVFIAPRHGKITG